MEASIAPSIRWKATRLPPESTTATLIFQFRFFASVTAREYRLSSVSELDGHTGVSKELSGTKIERICAVGCGARSHQPRFLFAR